MDKLPELIREYRHLLRVEQEIETRKAQLRALILEEMALRGVKCFSSEEGIAKCNARFKLIPKKTELLQLLTSEDILPFAQFSPTKVKEWLVPKYGRERLLPLFLSEKISYLQVTPPAKPKGNGTTPF